MVNQYSKDLREALEAVNARNRHQISPMCNSTYYTDFATICKIFTYSLHVFNDCNKIANASLST